MCVWIEPLEWDESKGPNPIAQLDVRATNYLNEVEVEGHRAVAATDASCPFFCLAWAFVHY